MVNAAGCQSGISVKPTWSLQQSIKLHYPALSMPEIKYWIPGKIIPDPLFLGEIGVVPVFASQASCLKAFPECIAYPFFEGMLKAKPEPPKEEKQLE